MSGFIYPIIGHWAWGPDGWLATMGSDGNFLPGLGMSFHDFAGSTVVHTHRRHRRARRRHRARARASGASSSATAAARCLPHDITIGAVGGLILWFGWYGFNPGSTLSAMDVEGIGRVAANTTLAACSAGLTALFYRVLRRRKTWDAGFTINGFLAGLVAITCPCYWVVADRRDPHRRHRRRGRASSAIDVLEYLRIDDPIGAVPVHGICGIWGTLSLGLFAAGQYGAPAPTGADNIGAAHRPLLRRRLRPADRPSSSAALIIAGATFAVVDGR